MVGCCACHRQASADTVSCSRSVECRACHRQASAGTVGCSRLVECHVCHRLPIRCKHALHDAVSMQGLLRLLLRLHIKGVQPAGVAKG
eukprot:scaffold307294_cov21-Tisochrysis_lutea.AAC.3